MKALIYNGDSRGLHTKFRVCLLLAEVALGKYSSVTR